MLAITHIIVSLLLIQIFLLDRNEAFVALLFGVFIDVDHLFGLHLYAKANGVMAVFDVDSLMNADGHWKSMMHNPVAVGIVGPLSVAFRLGIPLVFWGLHVTMDFLEDAYLGLFSSSEAILLLLATFALISIRYGKYLESYSAGTLGHYFRMEYESVRSMFRTSG